MSQNKLHHLSPLNFEVLAKQTEIETIFTSFFGELNVPVEIQDGVLRASTDQWAMALAPKQNEVDEMQIAFDDDLMFLDLLLYILDYPDVITIAINQEGFEEYFALIYVLLEENKAELLALNIVEEEHVFVVDKTQSDRNEMIEALNQKLENPVEFDEDEGVVR